MAHLVSVAAAATQLVSGPSLGRPSTPAGLRKATADCSQPLAGARASEAPQQLYTLLYISLLAARTIKEHNKSCFSGFSPELDSALLLTGRINQ